MLQGALAAVAAKAKEAKAAVGEIRDAIDNPTYDDDEEGEWSDEEGDEGGRGEQIVLGPGERAHFSCVLSRAPGDPAIAQ